MMGIIDKRGYEAKQAWADRRMRENAEIDTLTAEQHNALRNLCAIRHWVHCNYIKAFNNESAEYDQLWQDYLREGWEEELMKVGLPELKHINLTCLPDSSDYELILTNEEREEWEQRAEAEDSNSGYSLWIDEGEEYQEYINTMERLNNDIESYLRRINNKYGTNYAPSGATRL